VNPSQYICTGVLVSSIWCRYKT